MKIPVDNCGELGLALDIYPQELAPNGWSAAKNFRFRDGFAEKFSGEAAVYGTPVVQPYHLTNFLSTAGYMWVYAGLQKIYAVDTSFVHSNITRQTSGSDVNYTGTAKDKWNGGVLSGVVILNNGVDYPQYWPGSGLMQALPNWPVNTYAKIMRPFRNYLVALNVTKNGNNYPHLIKWSHHADPGTVPTVWDVADATKDAGEYDLADDQTELVDGLGLGDQFIAYKRSGYYSVQYIGTPFIFRFQKISGLYGGALAVNCVTEFPGGHFVLGPGDVYVHQGGAPQSVIDAKNRKWLFKQLDSDNRVLSFVTQSPLANELWICFPQQGDSFCTLALVFNWKYNTWGIRELPYVTHAAQGSVNYQPGKLWTDMIGTWESAQLSWDQNLSQLSIQNTMLASPSKGKLYAVETTSQFDGTDFQSYVERKHLRFEKPDTVKLLKQVRPLIEGPLGSTINIYVSSSYDQTADPVQHGPFPFIIGQNQKIDCHVTGRMLGVRFEATGSFPWRLKRYDVDVTEIGEY